MTEFGVQRTTKKFLIDNYYETIYELVRIGGFLQGVHGNGSGTGTSKGTSTRTL